MMFPTLLAQTETAAPSLLDRFPLAYICIALGALGYFALQFGVLKSRAVAAIGILLLIAAGGLAASQQVVSLETIVLIAFIGLALFGCVCFVTLREPVYAALGFATAVLSSCGVLFMQYAYFVSAATMIVYAGATIIIFLFVLMFAQKEHLQTYDLRLNTPLVSIAVAGLLFALIYYGVTQTKLTPASPAALATRSQTVAIAQAEAPAKTPELGRGLYTDYLVLVEVAGTLLLIATIGAIGVASRSLEADTP
jgi:NADH-quinone oxidoreductase subunit J